MTPKEELKQMRLRLDGAYRRFGAACERIFMDSVQSLPGHLDELSRAASEVVSTRSECEPRMVRLVELYGTPDHEVIKASLARSLSRDEGSEDRAQKPRHTKPWTCPKCGELNPCEDEPSALGYCQNLGVCVKLRARSGVVSVPELPPSETCPRCGLVDCSLECIAAEQAEVDAYDGPIPDKFA